MTTLQYSSPVVRTVNPLEATLLEAPDNVIEFPTPVEPVVDVYNPEKIVYNKEGVLGEDGLKFNQLKLRTMYPGADKNLRELISENGLDHDGGVKNDPRIIPIYGHILRRTHLDEILNLINVLKGEMRLFGIRPRRPCDWEDYSEEHKERAIKRKPGCFPPRYFLSYALSFRPKTQEDHTKIEEHYLGRVESNPVLTDLVSIPDAIAGTLFYAGKLVYDLAKTPYSLARARLQPATTTQT